MYLHYFYMYYFMVLFLFYIRDNSVPSDFLVIFGVTRVSQQTFMVGHILNNKHLCD